MRRLNTRNPRIAGLLALVLGAVALLAVSGVATARDRGGDDHGNHGRHHHHRHDHRALDLREAGTIASFDTATGKLTITLLDGSSVTGLVTEDTRIRCEGVDDHLARRDHGSGDDNGGQVEPGDDHGGEGTPAEVAPGEVDCTTASLVPGATVGDAELRVGDGSAVFTEVELGHHS